VDYFYGWLMILFASLLGSMIPGISFALVLRNTLRSSRMTGVWTAFGLALGMSIYALIVLLGLAVLILHNPILANIIRFGGAIYLAYIGIQCLLAKHERRDAENGLPASKMIKHHAAFRMGFLTNMLNPKVILFFLALFTQFIYPGMPLVVQSIYGATVVLVEFFWFSFVAILLTHPQLNRYFQSVSCWIERCSGVILLLISLRLVVMHAL